jgi:tetratricopeptide (TPR) repeat protein
LDSTFNIAMMFLSVTYNNIAGLRDSALKLCLKAYEIRDKMPAKQKIFANALYALLCDSPFEQIKYNEQFLAYDDQSPLALIGLGTAYNTVGYYDKSIVVSEKALKLYNQWGVKPQWEGVYQNLGAAYHAKGKYRAEEKLYKKAEKDFPDNQYILSRQAILALTTGDTKEANRHINNYISKREEQSVSETDLSIELGNIYSRAGIPDKAEEYYRKALSFSPDNPSKLNTLAFFLIDEDRNIKEGMDLIEKALEKSPENFYYLDCKGWGLYKQGNYKESLEILQKNWNNLRSLRSYSYRLYLHLEEVKKAVANQK